MTKEDIKKIVESNSNMRDKLFVRGFYFSDACVNEKEYPFYGQWVKQDIGKYTLLVSPKQKFCVLGNGKNTFALIGHAYNPIKMLSDEKDILKILLNTKINSTEFWNCFNELTGVFTLIYVVEKEVYVVGDPTCMQTTFYADIGQHFFVSSHTNLLGDLLNLEWDDYVKRLSRYRFFRLLGNSLPGDLTQFPGVKRLVPNHYIEYNSKRGIQTHRFFWPEKLLRDNHEIAYEVGKLLSANLQLIAKKWSKPAISMTGGCDSKTTLACAAGFYDKFSYFSYISSDAEAIDAQAARQICNALEVEHTNYEIPREDSELQHIEEARTILEWNMGGIIPNNENDVRKRSFFADTKDFDVEVKSWASEIGRAYYSKRFHGRKNFGRQPTPRKCTTMYKFFLHNRRLVKETDQVFRDYLDHFFEQSKNHPIEWQEQLFWEFRVPSWNGLVITGEHRYSFDITIPYNNRLLLNLLVSAPIDDRIQDSIYSEIRKLYNSKIDATGIAVTNLKHTKNREKAENLYFLIHSAIPF